MFSIIHRNEIPKISVQFLKTTVTLPTKEESSSRTTLFNMKTNSNNIVEELFIGISIINIMNNSTDNLKS